MSFCITQPTDDSFCYATSTYALERYAVFNNVANFVTVFDQYRDIMFLYIDGGLTKEFTRELSLQLSLHLIVFDYKGIVDLSLFDEGDFIGTTGPAKEIFAEKVGIKFSDTTKNIHGYFIENIQTTLFGQNYVNVMTQMRRKYGVNGRGKMWRMT